MDNRWTSVETDFDEFGTCTYLVLCFIRNQDEPINIVKFSDLSEVRKFTRHWCLGKELA